MKKLNNPVDILKDLATLEPLNDKALKILLSDDEHFRELAEACLDKKIAEGDLLDINGELLFSVKGKLVRLDSVRRTIDGLINIEGQTDQYKFPFKRHLYYWAAMYVSELPEGAEYKDLKSAISIVVYKDKGDTELIEKAYLRGELVKTEDDSSQLNLVAINTKKWRSAPTEKMRTYMSILHNGIMLEETKNKYADIDTETETFKKFYQAVTMACARIRYEEHKSRGDEHMSVAYKSFISEEERALARQEGMQKGMQKGKIELYYTELGYTTKQIADRLKIPADHVTKILKELNIID